MKTYQHQLLPLITIIIVGVVTTAVPVSLCLAVTGEQLHHPEYGYVTRDTVLAWDDGENGIPPVVTGGYEGTKIAVKFTAPSWAYYVTEIHYFIQNQAKNDASGGVAQYKQQTLPFTAWVWKPDGGGLPGEPGNSGEDSGGGYPDEGWLELVLSQAVDISDGAEYPGGIFFVGLEILHDFNPSIGVDLSPPVDLMTYRNEGTGWDQLIYADAMIRAVVSDTPTGVEDLTPMTWSAIKSMYK